MKSFQIAGGTATVIVTLLLAACGSPSDSDESAESSVERGGDSTEVVKAAQANVEKGMTPFDDVTEPTTTVTPKPDQFVGMVDLIASSPGIARISSSQAEAAKELGYESKVVDGAFTPKGFSDGDELLIQFGVDGIIHNVIADSATPASVKRVIESEIKLVCVSCGNVYGAATDPPSTSNVDPDFIAQGELLADWMIADSGGAAKVAIFDDESVPVVHARAVGVRKGLEKCPACEVVADIPLNPSQDLIGEGRKAAQALVQRYPKGEIDYLVAVSDTEAIGPSQALDAAGRDEIKIGSFDCDPPNLGMIRDGGPQAACVAVSLEWQGWASMDTMVRLLAGQEPSDFVPPSMLITQANVPEGDDPFADAPFREHYRELWGIN